MHIPRYSQSSNVHPFVFVFIFPAISQYSDLWVRAVISLSISESESNPAILSYENPELLASIQTILILYISEPTGQAGCDDHTRGIIYNGRW